MKGCHSLNGWCISWSCSCPAYTRMPLRFTSMCDRATPWLRIACGPPFNYNSMSSPELAQQVVPEEFPWSPKYWKTNRRCINCSPNHLTQNALLTDWALTLNFFYSSVIENDQKLITQTIEISWEYPTINVPRWHISTIFMKEQENGKHKYQKFL